MNELCSLASAIDAGNVPLPPFTARLIQQAPESFTDPRAGEIAVTVRAMRRAGEPVTLATVGSKHLALAAFIGGELAGSALSLASAEFYAEQYWREYQARRTVSVLGDAYQDLVGRPEYTQVVIEGVRRALDDLDRESPAHRFTVRQPDELLDLVFDDRDIILGDRLIAEGQSCVIAAAGGIGKSRLSLQMAASIVTGRPFLNFTTGKPEAAWLFLQTENSNRRLVGDLQRLRFWLGEDWPKFAAQVKFHTVENDTDSFVNLDSPEAVANLEGAIKQHAPDIIVVDPLNDFAIGDLNKDADMKLTLQTLSRISRKGNPQRALIVLHHALTGKAGASKATGFDRSSFGRNSKALFAWTRAQINLAPAEAENNGRLIVACGKCSNGREFPTFAIRLNPETMIYECDSTVDVAAWQSAVTGKSEGPDLTPAIVAGVVAELCKSDGAPKKPQIVKALRAETGCVSGSAYRAIERAERSRRIHFTEATKTYVVAT
jgi:hypothetical protein